MRRSQREGRAFSAGLDFGSFQRMRDEGPRKQTSAEPDSLDAANSGSPANRAQLTSHVWSDVPVPVIAAVHGYAFGGGLQIALGADIRIISPDAQLSVMEIRWGLIPDMAGTQKLRHLVRLDVAKELTFTGRRVSGTEAVELGLATRVSETPLKDALAMARQIADNSPHATRAAKNLLDASVQLDVAEGFKLEESLQRSLIGTPNQKEAVRANMEERAPVFSDPST